MPRLALRLWAQPHCSRTLGRTCVLLEHAVGSGEAVVLCIDLDGVAALVCESGDRAPAAPLARGEPPEAWPALQLQRGADGEARWVSWPSGSPKPAALTPSAARASLTSRPALTTAGRRAIVGAIHGYYTQHVLEPSVGGFLSLLSKQFARSDLYLFELLQNAVDEGANLVRVELSNSPPSLRFTHDGAPFTPLDVNGLASVGMSTKAGHKRAVGFMGIGFKARRSHTDHRRSARSHLKSITH